MTDEQRIEIIAAACHSAWYAYTVLGLGEEGESWSTAPRWQKDSIRHAVVFWDEWRAQFNDAGTDEELRRDLPVASHQNWMDHKAREGWTYGPLKITAKKKHPCMVPYGDLPAAQQKKDAVVVEAYLAMYKAIETFS